ncbi:MAG TPA: hypothetical protein VJZ76_02535 [Thermoanaerobaculia bacterium]|nr:hypothetical protein [Thermoanaerobaculia bacterium]
MREITIHLGEYIDEERRRRHRSGVVAGIAVVAALLVIAMPRTAPPPLSSSNTTTTATSTTVITATTATIAPPPPAPEHLAPLSPTLTSAPTHAKRPPHALRVANDRAADVDLGKTTTDGTVTPPAAEAPAPPVVEAAPAKIDIEPRQIAFVRTSRTKRDVVLVNHGGKPTTVGLAVTGISFGFVVETKVCDGKTLSPGESCTFSVTALPIAFERGSSMRIVVSYDGHTDYATAVSRY